MKPVKTDQFLLQIYAKNELEELVGGTKLENCCDLNVHIFEAFRLTLVKKNRQNGERRKMSDFL